MKKILSLVFALLFAFCHFTLAYAQEEADKTISVPAAFEVTQNSLLLKWDAVTGAYGYKIYMKSENSKKYEFYAASFDNFYTVQKLKRASVYYFKITALFELQDGSVKESEKSKPLMALTSPGKPSSVLTTETDKNHIAFSWNKAKGADYYEIWFYSKEKGEYVFCTESAEASYKKDDLKENSIYSFRIRAVCKKEQLLSYGEYVYHYDFTCGSALPKTNSQAAKYYNDSINSLKEKDNIKITHKKSVETEAYSASKNSLLRTVKNMMNVFEGSVKKTYTFKKNSKEETTPDNIIEPLGRNASLKGAYIKSFSFKEEDGKLRFKIKLKSEEADFTGKKTEKPTYNFSVMKKLNISSLKTSPLKIINGTSYFDGAEITVIYTDANISKISIKSKCNVFSNLSVSDVDFNCEVGYTVKNVYTVKGVE